MALVFFGAVGVALIVFVPGWPAVILGVPVGMLAAAGTRLSWRSKPKRRFRDIWWVVVLVVLLADISGGILGQLVGFVEADYQFNRVMTTALPDGSYQQLGEADGLLYLQRCGSSQIYSVNEQAIVLVREKQVSVRSAPSLFDVLRSGATPQLGALSC